MRLKRLVEMIQEDGKGAEDWPVLFASFRQNSAGEWREVEGVRQPITSVLVEESAEEILLITDRDRPPLSLARLEEELARLISCLSGLEVEWCGDIPIVLDSGGTLHIDWPVVGVARDENNRCFLVIYASKVAD
jgi:hypothetical protein